MGVSAGRVAVDDGESMGTSVQEPGKTLDEDLLRDCEDQDCGGLLGRDPPEYQQAVGRVRIIEQVRQNLAHQRHSRLHARQEDSQLSGAAYTVGEIVNTMVPKVSDIQEVASTGPIVSITPIISTDSSKVLSSGLAVSSTSVQTDMISSVPIGTTLQTLLSSTPPPSPVETSVGMTIPSITTTSSVPSTITTQPSSAGSTDTRSYTTITSYWTSQTLRNNGTALSNTRTTSSSVGSTASTVTLDGTVIVFAYPTNISSNTGNSSTQSTTSSVLSSSSLSSSNSTTSASSPTSSLWSSTAGVAGGGGGGYVAPTSSTAASIAPVSTSTGASTSNSPPVSPSLLGGVLGGVAGLAFVLVAILYMVRRHRREIAERERDDAGYGGPLERSGPDQMTQRLGIAPFAVAGSFFSRHSRQSHVSQSPETTSQAEVGFIKVSGRKLPPVIGGPRPGYDSTRSAGGSSEYPDDDGITVASTPSVVGPSRYSSMTAASASPTSLTAPMTFVPPSPAQISSVHPPHIGPSMATPPPRIPEEASESDTGSTSNFPPLPFPRQLSAVSVGSLGKDGVGRSLPSRDGSRASRFTEDV